LSVKDQEDQEVDDAKSRDSILPLRSVYGCMQGEPAFTNFTPDFTGTLDYIFASSLEHIKAVSLLELPTHDSVEVVGGLPNRSHPSDHLPIGFEFIIRSRK
jgi:CCR4-NOT transcription complex subunit 6